MEIVKKSMTLIRQYSFIVKYSREVMATNFFNVFPFSHQCPLQEIKLDI